MNVYATVGDMIEQFGEGEVRQLSDRDNTGLVDQVVVARALERSSADIDGYIGWLHSTSISAGAGARNLLKGLCCDMARYRLAGSDGRLATDEMRDRNREAVRMLTMIAKGEIKLHTEDVAAPANQDRVQRMNVGTRIGNDLKDYF